MQETTVRPAQGADATGGRRRLWVALPVVAVAGGITAWAMLHGGSDAGSGATRSGVYAPTTYQVTYEVAGQGTVENITYMGDPAKDPVVLRHVSLPWSLTLNIPVGLTAGSANVESANPSTTAPEDVAPLVCKIVVDGKKVAQRTSVDGFADAACSATLLPKHG
jgi:hypothetical protein